MQRAGLSVSRPGLGRMIHQQQDAAWLQRCDNLIQHCTCREFWPRPVRSWPIQIMIYLDHQNGVESITAEAKMFEVDRPLFYVRQAMVGKPCDPTVRTKFLECLVVQDQNVALRTDHVTDEFAV